MEIDWKKILHVLPVLDGWQRLLAEHQVESAIRDVGLPGSRPVVGVNADG